MKKSIKILLFFIIVVLAFLLIPNFSKAATIVNDEESLVNAIENATPGETIMLEKDITVTKPIVITKALTINGKGFTVTGSDTWTSTTGNQTMFTAQLSDAKLILTDIKLKNGPKYGVQAYNGASVTLDDVSITGFKYGAVLVNGASLEVKNVHLGKNGTTGNNGIEIDKGSGVDTIPTLMMNGTLKSDLLENVIHIANSGNIGQFTINNTDNTVNKVVLAGNKIVLTDSKDNVISETSIPEGVNVNVEEKTVIVTLIANDITKQITVDIGKTITPDVLKSHIELQNNYKIDGYYTDENYTNVFKFDEPLTKETTIYVKISEENKVVEAPVVKDETPKTGGFNYLPISILLIAISIVGLFYLKKKENYIK